VEWVTEITHVVEGSRFIDEQRLGPYRLWRHEHSFRAVGRMTEMRDVVYYALPLGRLGALANPLVRSRIEHIFECRAGVLSGRFNGARRPLAAPEVSPRAASV